MRRATMLASLAAAATAPAAAATRGDADLIVTATTIHTSDPRTPNAQAFADFFFGK